MAKAAVHTKDDDDDEVVTKKSAKEVAPIARQRCGTGLHGGTNPGSRGASPRSDLDTPTYGTETPPRQTPPTNIENYMKHSPPHFHDSNGVKIASVAPTLTSISPSTAVAVTGADLTVTGTGTNFDRATFLTAGGATLTNTQYRQRNIADRRDQTGAERTRRR